MGIRTVIPGPPGTGKTFRLVNHYLEKEINRLQPEEKVLPYKERLHRQSVAKYEKALKVPKGADPTKHGFKNKNEYLVALNPFHRHNSSPQIKYYVNNPLKTIQ